MDQELVDIETKAKLEKLKVLREIGIEPYGSRFEKSHSIQEIRENEEVF